MTEPAELSQDDESAQLEELMIQAAKNKIASLPLLEAKSALFIEAIGPTMSKLVGADVTVEAGQVQYTTLGEALRQCDDAGTFIHAEAAPWRGKLSIWCETPMIGRLIDTLLGSRDIQATDQDRTFTRIEMRLVRQIGQALFDQFGNALSEVRNLDFRVTGFEAPDTETPECSSELRCCVLRTEIIQGEVRGRFALILPFEAFTDDYDVLASAPKTPQNTPLGTWRDEISKVLTGTGVKLTAILGDTSVPLSEALSWRKGSMIRLGAGSSDAVRVTCEGHTIFSAVPGRRSNGALALRITSDVEIERIAQND